MRNFPCVVARDVQRGALAASGGEKNAPFSRFRNPIQFLHILQSARATGRCEYCHFPEAEAGRPFQIDHIIARKHGGSGDETNLALACLYCNSAKAPSIAGIDPLNDAIVRLFHPRRDLWHEHFAWRGAWLSGRTPEARATITVLRINDSAAVAVRESLLEEGIGLD